MEIIYKPRRAGKTRDLIVLASKAKYGLIVCHSQDEANRVWYEILKMERCKAIEKCPPQPITYNELLNKNYSRFVDEIFIDNAELFLQYFLAPAKIGAISLNEE
jgi:hypothetical protein